MNPLATSGNYFYIRFGERTTPLISFHQQPRLDEIEEHTRLWFNEALPSARRIEFYSRTAKKVLILDEDVLRCDNNPFLVNTGNDGQINDSVTDYIELFVVENSNTYSTPNLPTNVSGNNIGRTEFPEEGKDDHSPTEISHTAANPETSIIVKENSLTTAPSDELNNQSTGLRFCHDVDKYQKDNYLSDAYRVGQHSVDDNTNGKTRKGIGFVQGIKEEGHRQEQVLPKIRGLQQYQNDLDADLYIYGVHEELSADGCRVWKIHRDKNFLLPNELQSNAKPYNPIKFSLNGITLTENGEFPLKFYMITKWEKDKKEETFCTLDEASTLQRHPAPHQKQSLKRHIPPVRFIAIIKRGDIFDLDTFCLSDFIQSVKFLEQNPSSTTTTQIDKRNPSKRKKTETCSTTD